MPDAPVLDPALAATAALGCAMGGTVLFFCLRAPRLLWPDRVAPLPDPPAERPDWPWPWLLALPPLVVALQFVAYPLRFAGVRPTPWVALAISMGSGLATTGLAWALLCRRLGRPAASLGLRWPRWKPHVAWLPAFGYPFGLCAMLLAIVFEMAVLKRPLPSAQAAMKMMRAMEDPALRVFAVAAVAVVAPFAEEVLFRGVLFRGLRLRWGLVPAMLASAALFSAAHLDIGHALPIFVLGLVLAFLVEESGSVWPGIAMHAMVNGVATTLAWKLPAG